MHTTIAPFSLRPMKVVEQANRLMQRAQVLYEEHENIMEPKDREEAKDRMIEWVELFHQAAVFQILRQPYPQRQGSQTQCAGEVLAGSSRGGETVFKPCSRSVRDDQGLSNDSICLEVLIGHVLSHRESSTKRSKSGTKRKGFGDSFPPLLYNNLSTVAVDSALGPGLPNRLIPCIILFSQTGPDDGHQNEAP
ncbi:hypothetical protein EDB85DRAFT_2030382 [Lactarius pseudohatsudake]|nr:hypothetical protein EDB85DRAFT_2030382 [Lactarius pseudohatsudake]